MKENFLKSLAGKSNYYPQALEQKFPHIFEKIVTLWDTPSIEPYFNELMMDSRDGKREGFPPDVASEIFRISMLSSPKSTTKVEDVWGNEFGNK